MFEFDSLPCLFRRAVLHAVLQAVNNIYLHIIGLIIYSVAAAVLSMYQEQNMFPHVLTMQATFHFILLISLMSNKLKKNVKAQRRRRRVSKRARG